MENENCRKTGRPPIAKKIEEIGIADREKEALEKEVIDKKAQEKDNEVRKELEKYEKKDLIDYIMYLRSARAFFREDRLKLQILDNADFTIWACDRDFNIKLWEGSCEKVYSCNKENAIGKNYLELFVSPLERYQSKMDTLEIIDTGEKQSFRLCEDTDRRGFPIQLITQCCQIEDDEDVNTLEDGTKNNHLQAEMAINMNYDSLLEESNRFIKNQEDFLKEVEKTRGECLSVLQKCKDRVLEEADHRIDQYYHIAFNGKTYDTALNAIWKIVDHRKTFLDEFQNELIAITNEACHCDLENKIYPSSEYTFENGHSFNCVCRQNRREINRWRAKIEKWELKCQQKIAEVQLTPP